MYVGLHVWYRIFLSNFSESSTFQTDFFFEKHSEMKGMNIRPANVESFNAG